MPNNLQPRLMLDTTNVIYELSIPAVPKLDQNGAQKIDRESGQPMWSVVLYGRGHVGSQPWSAVFNVTVVSAEKPSATVCQQVVPTDLEALPWTSERDGKTRSGLAFKASALQVIEAVAAVPVAA
jgi:hypothetical protein